MARYLLFIATLIAAVVVGCSNEKGGGVVEVIDANLISEWKTEVKNDQDVTAIMKQSNLFTIGISYMQEVEEKSRPYVCIAIDGRVVYSGQVDAPLIGEETWGRQPVGLQTIVAEDLRLEKGRHVVLVLDATSNIKGKAIIELSQDSWIEIIRCRANRTTGDFIVRVANDRPRYQ